MDNQEKMIESIVEKMCWIVNLDDQNSTNNKNNALGLPWNQFMELSKSKNLESGVVHVCVFVY